MLSLQGATISKAMSLGDNTSSQPWGADEELDWLLKQTEPQVDHDYARANVHCQSTMTPQSWTPYFPVHQSSNSSQHIPLHQFFSFQPQPVPTAHPPQIPSSIYRRTNIAAKSQHHARITLVRDATGGFKTIVKRKRKRTMFTTEQVAYLESVFRSKQYICREERQILVDQLGLSDSSIKVWFQNRRIRSKRDEDTEETDCQCSPSVKFYVSSSASPLETMESTLFQKVDEFGYVTLDESEMEVLVTAIDSVLSTDISLELESKDSDQSTTESEGSCSMYEPISPASVEIKEEETLDWESEIASKQSLKKMFDLHFC